ncbi:MAG: hypothetical protein K2L10_09465 [Ruminococcus sp.]|nr:hypothetical protein [Ruminococcus sp.]
MRWNKAQNELYSRLADCLKKRVIYDIDIDKYTDTHIHGFRIIVDGETWFENNEDLWENKVVEYGSQHTKPPFNDFMWLTLEASNYGVLMTAKEIGLINLHCIYDIVQKYLNIYKIDKCLNHDNYIFRVLAVLDHRTGRRKIKQLLENIDNEPIWFRKYIRLRAKAQNIYID